MGTTAPYNIALFATVTTAVLLGIGPGLVTALLGNLGVMAFVVGSLPTMFQGTTLVRLGASVVVGVFVTVVIHATRVAQLKARASEDRYRALFNLCPDAILVHAGGKFVFANPAASLLFGANSPQDLIGQDVLERIHRDDRPAATQLIQQAYAGAVTPPREMRFLRFDGVAVEVEVTGAKVEFGGQPAIQMVVRDITGRRRAEAALRDSEARYRNLFENLPEEVQFWKLVRDDRGGIQTWRLVDANPPTLKSWGKTLDQIQGKTTDQILGPGATDHFMPVVQKIMAEGAPYSFEDYFPNLGKYFRFTSVPLGDHFITTGADITTIKKAQELVEQHNVELEQRVAERAADAEKERQRFHDVLNLLPAYVILLSPDYHVPFANRFFEQRFGKSQGKRCYEYLFNRTEPCPVCQTFNVLKTNVPHRWEWTGPDSRHYDIHDFPFTDSDGSTLIMEVGLDITETKQAQSALKELNEKLEQRVTERTAELQAIFDTAPIGLAIAQDPEGRHIRGNPANERMLGLEPGEELSLRAPQPPRYRALQDGRELAVQELPMQRAVRGETVIGQIIDIVRPDGQKLTLYSSTAPLFNEQGRPRGAVGAFLDITQRKRAERELFEINQRLEALMQALPVGVSFSDDPTCQRITGNPAVLAQFEVTPADNLSASAPEATAPGRQVHFFRDGQPITDADLPLQRAVAENRVIPPMVLEVQLPSGRRWFTQASGAPIRDRQGNVIGGVAVTVDITERKQAEAEIQRRTEELGATNAELSRFNQAMVGRELRMVELKKEVDILCAQLGQAPRYAPDLNSEPGPA